MDKRKTLGKDEAISLVRQYKQLISPRFDSVPKVYLYGSYSKGYANPWSDIDVAVIVPVINGDKFDISTDLTLDGWKVSPLIEPVLMAEDEPSPLYDDVMRTGIAI